MAPRIEHAGVVAGQPYAIIRIERTFTSSVRLWAENPPLWNITAVLENQNRLVLFRLRGQDELDVMRLVSRISRREEAPPYE